MECDNSDKEQGYRQNRRRRTQSKFNKQVPRYECFCSKQYLSYPALYLHLKNKHNGYFQCSKNGKRVETTKLVQSFNPNEGFKVYKISYDPASMMESERKEAIQGGKSFEQPFADNQVFYPANNYIYTNMPYQNYNFDYGVANIKEQFPKKTSPKEVVVELALSMFMHGQEKRSPKERMEIELLLALLVDSLNEHYQELGDERVVGKECRRYTAEYNCQQMHVILQLFQDKFLPAMMREENKNYSFFLKNAAIMTSTTFKKVLQEFLNFINGRKPDMTESKSQSQAEAEQEINMQEDEEQMQSVELNSSDSAEANNQQQS